MWDLSMELTSCHPSCASNCEVAPQSLENLCIPTLNYPYVLYSLSSFLLVPYMSYQSSLLYFIITKSVKEYKLQTFILYCFLQSPVTSTFLGPNMLLRCMKIFSFFSLCEWMAKCMWLQQPQIYLKVSKHSSFKYPEHCFWDDFINFKLGF